MKLTLKMELSLILHKSLRWPEQMVNIQMSHFQIQWLIGDLYWGHRKTMCSHFQKKNKKAKKGNRISLSNYSLTLSFFFFKIELQFTYPKIHPFKEYDSVMSNILTKLYNHSHCVIPEYVHYPEKKPCTH